jgi:hypothetical protein
MTLTDNGNFQLLTPTNNDTSSLYQKFYLVWITFDLLKAIEFD